VLIRSTSRQLQLNSVKLEAATHTKFPTGFIATKQAAACRAVEYVR